MMTSFISASPTTGSGSLDDFSLLGGPLHRLGARFGLVRGQDNTIALGLALGWLPWLVMIALAMVEGVGDKLFSLSVIAGHVRLLIVIPLFFLCETSVDAKLREFIGLIVRSGVVPADQSPLLENEIARTVRWKDSWFSDAVCVLAAVALSIFAGQLHISGRTSSFDPGRVIGDAPLAGLWYWIVCLPLFRFLMFRWLWRIALWWGFVWRLSRMDLRLVPAHPDGAGGLGYLEVVQMHFAALVFSISIVVAASFAEEISTGRTVFEVIYPALAITIFVDLVLFLGPPCLFAFKLRTAQEKALSDYSELAARYVNAFEKKWLNTTPDEPLLGTPDLQSLADLGNSMAVVRNMRWAPFSTRLVISILGASLAPMLPLFLFKYPAAALVEALFKKLAGL
ncbi:hypothetical protein LG047_01880 [Methylocystis sp. WRRC1]|uniref:hypothetical protein n=1 Tax=Methylocystis sp. WRRC1 TaxID=1732014 RepID=UPI001D13BC8B|nr:hypothetical protein [Methylocystis sp. WRRC1]MCC3244079.1 hypothetical protein [Methylocystis sp. WRRC1]